MPYLNNKYICRHGGCFEAVDRAGYCELHATANMRPSAARRGYDRKWRKLRDTYIAEHPVCEHCGRRPAQDVDHIIPFDKGGGRLDSNNLQALCRKCHNRKTHGIHREGD